MCRFVVIVVFVDFITHGMCCVVIFVIYESSLRKGGGNA